jgi:hypothetical protein
VDRVIYAHRRVMCVCLLGENRLYNPFSVWFFLLRLRIWP